MKLDVQNLGKQFQSGQWGLRNCSFSFDGGMIGVVGPVGAGKTTLLRLLATVMCPTEGQILWDEVDVFRRPANARRRLGYLPRDFGGYPGVSLRQFLAYLAAVKGLTGQRIDQRVTQVMSDLGLAEYAGHTLGQFSLELRRRVGLAQALLADPALLLIDEPAAGLPPHDWVALQPWLACALESLTCDRPLALIATDDIAQIADLATTFLLLAAGKQAEQTTAAEMIGRVHGRVWQVTVDQAAAAQLRARRLIAGQDRRGDQVDLRVIADAPPGPDAVPVNPTLSDAYRDWIGR